MKKLLLLIGLISIVIVGCEDDRITVDPDLIQADHKAGSTTLSIKSNISWTIEVTASWLAVEPGNGSEDASISLSYAENKAFTPRDAIVSIKGGNSEELSVLVTQGAAPGFEISWEQMADMPTERSFSSPNACIINNNIYVIGGVFNGEPTNAVEAYDPSLNSWVSKAPLNQARWGHIAEVVDGKIYVMGGCFTTLGEPTNDMQVYDPLSDTWSSAGRMPIARLAFGSCVVNEQIYVMGGRAAEPGGEFYASSEKYDPSTGEWISLSPMPDVKGYFSATAIDQTIYAISGVNKGGGSAAASIFTYNIPDDTWSEELKLNEGRWGIVSCRVDSLIICAGGYTSPTGSPKTTVEIIYTNTDVILETTRMIHGTAIGSICQFDGKIFVFGGANVAVPKYGQSNQVQVGTFILPE